MSGINSLKIKESYESIIVASVAILEDLIDKESNNTNTSKEESKHPVFLTKAVPKISLLNFILRLVKYCEVEKSTYLLMLIYLNKIEEKVAFTIKNIFKLVLASIICSIKFSCDSVYTTTYYAKVGGVDISEYKLIESEFLELLQYDLFVSDKEFSMYSSLFTAS